MLYITRAICYFIGLSLIALGAYGLIKVLVHVPKLGCVLLVMSLAALLAIDNSGDVD